MADKAVQGLEELKRNFYELPRRVRTKALKGPLLNAAKPIVQDAQARVPVLAQATPYRKPGTLKRNIRARVGRPLPNMSATVFIAVRQLTAKQISGFKVRVLKKRIGDKSRGALLIKGVSATINPNDPYYWRWVEFGTSKMAAQPFMRPAYESQRSLAARIAQRGIRERISAEARYLAMKRAS